MALKILTNEAKAKLNQYRGDFLAAFPNTETNDDDSPKFTDAQWVDEIVKRYLLRSLKRGKRVRLEVESGSSHDLENE